MTNNTPDRCTLVFFYEWTCRINQTARPYEDLPCDTKANTSVARCEFTLVEGSPFALTRGRISFEGGHLPECQTRLWMDVKQSFFRNELAVST